jgi:hypothetical protein
MPNSGAKRLEANGPALLFNACFDTYITFPLFSSLQPRWSSFLLCSFLNARKFTAEVALSE